MENRDGLGKKYSIEQTHLLCSEIEKELKLDGGVAFDGVIRHTEELVKLVSEMPEHEKKIAEGQLWKCICQSQKYAKVFLYSSAITITHNSKLLEEFLEFIIEEKGFNANIKYFLFYQIKAAVFRNARLENNDIKYLKWRLLQQTVELFQNELCDFLVPIPVEERNKEIAFVITEQILSDMHGPTKVAFDRCKILMEEMHKKVLLINTAEVTTIVGIIPYFDTRKGTYIEKYHFRESLEWKGTRIPYFQCEDNMPNFTDLRTLLQMVRNVKPGLVVAIGGSGMLVNLVNSIIPVLTVGLSSFDLEPTMTACQTLSRPLGAGDMELLNRLGIDENSVIQSVFTFDLRPQGCTITREELGLPENKFILTIVGYRLDTDIDREFMRMISRTMDENTAIAVIGKFEAHEKYMDQFPELRGKVFCLGLTEDILAWIETCDLYVNPYRKGGGTSSVEALYKGIPVVTPPYGDVATNVGERFWTESYDTMPALIHKYKDDKAFYQEMSVKARERAAVLLDGAGEFKRVVAEFQKRTE